jgi:DNA-binding transcriptional regulator YhcF (GntR family)
MHFNFTDRVRKVLAMAREEAVGLRHDHVGTEHLLLALIRENEGVSAAVLAAFEVEPPQIRDRVEQAVRPGKVTISLGELPYTSQAKRALQYTMDEARALNHPYVGTEHLLLGLLRVDQGLAAQVLTGLGITLETARMHTLKLLGSPRDRQRPESPRGWLRRILEPHAPQEAPRVEREPPPRVSPQPAGFRITLDDTSSLPIYEQIIQQVQEGVATGRLQPGDRLPPVRQLADELEIAPGTVARAYGELERVGVVVTEGARGTRVAERVQQPLTPEHRPATLVGLLRPVVVAAYHLGASASELRDALQQAMRGIFDKEEGGAAS